MKNFSNLERKKKFFFFVINIVFSCCYVFFFTLALYNKRKKTYKKKKNFFFYPHLKDCFSSDWSKFSLVKKIYIYIFTHTRTDQI